MPQTLILHGPQSDLSVPFRVPSKLMAVLARCDTAEWRGVTGVAP